MLFLGKISLATSAQKSEKTPLLKDCPENPLFPNLWFKADENVHSAWWPFSDYIITKECIDSQMTVMSPLLMIQVNSIPSKHIIDLKLP
jgi:hypothetical protein